jgi:hypothetical protein
MPDDPDTAAPRKPRRRRFQFRLRTLLFGVALLGAACGYVAHEASIVRERRAMLKRVVDRGGQVSYGPEDPQMLRRLLGDVGGCSILYPKNLSATEKVRISELFPSPDNWVGPDLNRE